MLNQEFESNIPTNTTPSQFSYFGEPISQEDVARRADDPFFDKNLIEVFIIGSEPVAESASKSTIESVIEPTAEPVEPIVEDPFAETEINIDYFGRTVHLLTIDIDSESVRPVLNDYTASVGTIALETSSEPSIGSPVASVIPSVVCNWSFEAATEPIPEQQDLQYEKEDLPENPYNLGFNEELIISGEAKALSLELLNGFCEGRRRLGSKRKITEKLLRMIVGNCIYYNKRYILVSMKGNKNYISDFGYSRSPNIELKLVNYLFSVGFIDLVKGQSYIEAKKAGFKAELSKIKINSEAFKKHSYVRRFIVDDSVMGCTVYAKDRIKISKDKEEFVLQDLRKNRYKMSSAGKEVYNASLTLANDYNALLERTEIINNNEIISYDRKKVKVVFGITPDLSTKGRWASSITNIQKHLRKTYLINGCETVERDYSCMHVGILLAKNGKQIEGDFYQMAGYGTEFRPTIKKIVNICLNMPSFQGLHPNLKKSMGVYEMELTGQYEAFVQGGIPLDLHRMPGVPVPYRIVDNAPVFQKFDKLRLIRAITKMLKDSPIKNELFAGKRVNPKKKGKVANSAGMYAMRYEAAIMERVTKHFTAKGIVVIPVYDSCIIARQYEEELVEVMKQAYFDEMGFQSAGINS